MLDGAAWICANDLVMNADFKSFAVVDIVFPIGWFV